MTDTNETDWECDDEEEWLPEDLEAAYLRAMEANDAVEHEFASVDESANVEAESTEVGDDESLEAAFAPDAENSDASVEPQSIDSSELSQVGAAQTGQTSSADNAEDQQSEAAIPVEEAEPATLAIVEAKSAPRVTPHQVVEAALFVGGVSLTLKKLASLLGNDGNTDNIEEILDELNAQYESENRPYEIKLVEGGYRLELRSEYDRVRNRVYGLGPKEVKLTQDAVEVLALVAYRQPITKSTIEKLGKSSPSGALRQLLRRQLIRIERGHSRKDDVKYHTTPRFLSLFGLGDLEELPQADELNLK